MSYWSAVTGALAGLLLLAALALLRQRGPVEDLPNHSQPADSVPVETRDVAMRSDAVADRSDVMQEVTSIDLRGASPTFRNGTLVFAIRRAGFFCAEVVSAHESADGVWVASCSDMLGYIVTLRAADQFDVHPVAQYFDGVTPVPVERDRSLEPPSLLRQPLR